MSYQDEIMRRVEKPGFGDFFRRPGRGVQEYLLDVGQSARADFCYEFDEYGRLFIEDEDDPAQRMLSKCN
jgi:hypothetical protein